MFPVLFVMVLEFSRRQEYILSGMSGAQCYSIKFQAPWVLCTVDSAKKKLDFQLCFPDGQ